MKKLSLLTLLVLLVLLISIPVSATSIYGMKGLLIMPVADTQPAGKLGLNFQWTKVNNYIGINYGLMENLEVYANMSNDNAFSNTNWTGGVKLRVFQETKLVPSVAVGIMNKDLYVVASKTMDLQSTLRGHIGYGTGTFDGFFIGVNKYFNTATIRNSGSRVTLPVMNAKVEYYADQVNLGLDVHLNDYFIINGGVMNFREPTIGFSYTNQF